MWRLAVGLEPAHLMGRVSATTHRLTAQLVVPLALIVTMDSRTALVRELVICFLFAYRNKIATRPSIVLDMEIALKMGFVIAMLVTTGVKIVVCAPSVTIIIPTVQVFYLYRV